MQSITAGENLKLFLKIRFMRAKYFFRFFRAACLTRSAGDIKKILEKYGLAQYDAYELLKKNGGAYLLTPTN